MGDPPRNRAGVGDARGEWGNPIAGDIFDPLGVLGRWVAISGGGPIFHTKGARFGCAIFGLIGKSSKIACIQQKCGSDPNHRPRTRDWGHPRQNPPGVFKSIERPFGRGGRIPPSPTPCR